MTITPKPSSDDTRVVAAIKRKSHPLHSTEETMAFWQRDTPTRLTFDASPLALEANMEQKPKGV